MAKTNTPPAPEEPIDQAPPADAQPEAPIVTPPAPEEQVGVVLLAPDGAASCTVDGVTYEVVEGSIRVDQSHVAVLIESHGYVTAE